MANLVHDAWFERQTELCEALEITPNEREAVQGNWSKNGEGPRSAEEVDIASLATVHTAYSNAHKRICFAYHDHIAITKDASHEFDIVFVHKGTGEYVREVPADDAQSGSATREERVSSSISAVAFIDIDKAYPLLAVGYDSGHFRLFSEKKLLAEQKFQMAPVAQITTQPTRSAHNDVAVLYEHLLVVILGASVAKTAHASLSAQDVPIPELSCKKWVLSEQSCSQVICLGAATPSEYDHIVSSTRASDQPEEICSYIVAGHHPMLALYTTQGVDRPFLSVANLATQVATEFSKAVFSMVSSFWGSSSSSKQKKKPPSNQDSASSALLQPGTPLPRTIGLSDQKRCVQSLAVSPHKTAVALTDNLGRVILLDIQTMTPLRLWKGYRDAKVMWVETTSQSSATSSADGSQQVPTASSTRRGIPQLAIYAPRRGLLEVWNVPRGHRTAAFNVGVGSIVFPVHRSSRAGARNLMVIRVSGKAYHLSLPYTTALSDAATSNIKQKRALDAIKQYLLQCVREGSEFAEGLVTQWLEVVSSSAYLSEALSFALGLPYTSASPTSSDDARCARRSTTSAESSTPKHPQDSGETPSVGTMPSQHAIEISCRFLALILRYVDDHISTHSAMKSLDRTESAVASVGMKDREQIGSTHSSTSEDNQDLLALQLKRSLCDRISSVVQTLYQFPVTSRWPHAEDGTQGSTHDSRATVSTGIVCSLMRGIKFAQRTEVKDESANAPSDAALTASFSFSEDAEMCDEGDANAFLRTQQHAATTGLLLKIDRNVPAGKDADGHRGLRQRLVSPDAAIFALHAALSPYPPEVATPSNLLSHQHHSFDSVSLHVTRSTCDMEQTAAAFVLFDALLGSRGVGGTTASQTTSVADIVRALTELKLTGVSLIHLWTRWARSLPLSILLSPHVVDASIECIHSLLTDNALEPGTDEAFRRSSSSLFPSTSPPSFAFIELLTSDSHHPATSLCVAGILDRILFAKGIPAGLLVTAAMRACSLLLLNQTMVTLMYYKHPLALSGPRGLLARLVEECTHDPYLSVARAATRLKISLDVWRASSHQSTGKELDAGSMSMTAKSGPGDDEATTPASSAEAAFIEAMQSVRQCVLVAGIAHASVAGVSICLSKATEASLSPPRNDNEDGVPASFSFCPAALDSPLHWMCLCACVLAKRFTHNPSRSQLFARACGTLIEAITVDVFADPSFALEDSLIRDRIGGVFARPQPAPQHAETRGISNSSTTTTTTTDGGDHEKNTTASSEAASKGISLSLSVHGQRKLVAILCSRFYSIVRPVFSRILKRHKKTGRFMRDKVCLKHLGAPAEGIVLQLRYFSALLRVFEGLQRRSAAASSLSSREAAPSRQGKDEKLLEGETNLLAAVSLSFVRPSGAVKDVAGPRDAAAFTVKKLLAFEVGPCLLRLHLTSVEALYLLMKYSIPDAISNLFLEYHFRSLFAAHALNPSSPRKNAKQSSPAREGEDYQEGDENDDGVERTRRQRAEDEVPGRDRQQESGDDEAADGCLAEWMCEDVGLTEADVQSGKGGERTEEWMSLFASRRDFIRCLVLAAISSDPVHPQAHSLALHTNPPSQHGSRETPVPKLASTAGLKWLARPELRHDVHRIGRLLGLPESFLDERLCVGMYANGDDAEGSGALHLLNPTPELLLSLVQVCRLRGKAIVKDRKKSAFASLVTKLPQDVERWLMKTPSKKKRPYNHLAITAEPSVDALLGLATELVQTEAAPVASKGGREQSASEEDDTAAAVLAEEKAMLGQLVQAASWE